ncbi:MAG: hypothetical protein KBD37_03750 [Burkholderiales bacterium]|nr:hypothetical protein [Burkholderiales bacterium]
MANPKLDKTNVNSELESLTDKLLHSISSYVVEARKSINKSIDAEMVKAYCPIRHAVRGESKCLTPNIGCGSITEH